VADVVLAVSELVTNAIRHAMGEGQLSVRLRTLQIRNEPLSLSL
jgi:anti-sigma regulatory factor (Ser/Thr protein kinase)